MIVEDYETQSQETAFEEYPEGAIPAISTEPEVLKPGDVMNVAICLDTGMRGGKRSYVLSLSDLVNAKVIKQIKFVTLGSDVDRLTVHLLIPRDIGPGFYVLAVLDEHNDEVVSDLIAVVDDADQQRFEHSKAGLEYSVQAETARTLTDYDRALTLAQLSAAAYEQSDNPQCAGYAYTDAAEIARLMGDQSKFQELGWKAVTSLVLSADTSAASAVAKALMVSDSGPDTVHDFIDAGWAALDASSSGSRGVTDKCAGVEITEKAILEVAAASMPIASLRHQSDKIVEAIKKSPNNSYRPTIDEIRCLAASEIVIYFPGVLLRLANGLALHVAQFIRARANRRFSSNTVLIPTIGQAQRRVERKTWDSGRQQRRSNSLKP